MRYPWLLFDADNTLFDYDTAEQVALKKAFEQFDTACENGCHQRYREINAALFRELEQGRITSRQLRIERFRRLFDEFGIALDISAFSASYLRYLADNASLIDGAREIVRSLFVHYDMLIVTDGLAEVQRSRFENCAIKEFFADILISEEIGATKPDPAFFDHVFDVIGRPAKEQVLIIGDSLTADMAGGGNYGIATCWYNPRRQNNEYHVKVDYEIADLKELADITA